MQQDHRQADHASTRISRLVFFGFAAVAAFFLITEHRAHLFGFLPFLLLAACPLMHLFHHRGHGGHRAQSSPPDVKSRQDQPPAGGGGDRH